MQLGVILLVCIGILCATGGASGCCRTLHIRPFTLFYIAVLALICNAFPLTVFQELVVNVAALVLLGFAAATAKRCEEGGLFWALLLSALGGVCMLLFLRAAPILPEQELYLGIIAAGAAAPLMKKPGAAMLCAALSPLFLSAWSVCLDLYAFGYTMARVGTDRGFDAQVAGMFLIGVCTWLVGLRRIVKENEV